ncbi:UNVERIFIED_CONTAM: hypothetical protein GTU68_032448, partial [Idotea baltica]|nr:hypothetical protein [Idotea baltica]
LESAVSVISEQISPDQKTQLREALEQLIPWRKGPFDLCGIDIDTEWRSDKKWDRLKNQITSLEDRLVLDVGCGNGYHMWRMLEQRPERVIGVDPSPRFSIQFEMVKRLAGRNFPIDLIPIPLEQIPRPLSAFHSVFSMGVIYHRRSPLEHIAELKDALLPGGELILESLVIAGDENSCLVPESRYAKMRNVWAIPSSAMMTVWLEKSDFVNIRIVDECVTTTDEQRKTEWM